MQIVTRRERGLFPTPKEIDLDCSCPDWADLCKHVAASLYGVGARLDQNPGLLFLLRGVDPTDLISKASAAEAVRQTTATPGRPAMSEAEVADVFGIELEPRSEVSGPAVEAPILPPPISAPTSAPAPRQRSPRKKPTARKLGVTARIRIAQAAKARWLKAKKRPENQRAVPPQRKARSKANSA